MILFFKKIVSHVLFYDQFSLSAWCSLSDTLSNKYVAVVCFLGCNIRNFEIEFIFLIKSFFYEIKKSKQTFEYLEKKELLSEKNNIFFIIFKGLSVVKFILRPKSLPLIKIGTYNWIVEKNLHYKKATQNFCFQNQQASVFYFKEYIKSFCWWISVLL